MIFAAEDQNANKMANLTPVSQLPFLMRVSRRSIDGAMNRDSVGITTADALPLALCTASAGLVFNRATRLTEVARETTDDR